MPAAIRLVRGQGTLVAVGFPLVALVLVGTWVGLHGAGLSTSVPAALVLVAYSACAEQVDFVVAPRMSVSPAGVFLVAAGLVGGPLVGACASASIEALTFAYGWRRRTAYAGAGALQGFAAGLVGRQLTLHSPGAALAMAAVGVLIGFTLNATSVVLIGLDRRVDVWSELAPAWRAVVLDWLLPWPLLAAFLFLFGSSPSLALLLGGALLLIVGVGNRVRLRLEQSLAEERSRARLDALTGAPNRYALAEALATEQARIMRGGRTAALCFLDLDHFGGVNKAYGWAAGDQLLVDVYQRVRAELRTSDQVFRWGGEEFVVLAPQIECHELPDFAARLRLIIASRPFVCGGEARTVTGSVGAVLLDESRSADDSLEAASQLARQAKIIRNTSIAEGAATAVSGSASP